MQGKRRAVQKSNCTKVKMPEKAYLFIFLIFVQVPWILKKQESKALASCGENKLLWIIRAWEDLNTACSS